MTEKEVDERGLKLLTKHQIMSYKTRKSKKAFVFADSLITLKINNRISGDFNVIVQGMQKPSAEIKKDYIMNLLAKIIIKKRGGKDKKGMQKCTTRSLKFTKKGIHKSK